MTPLEERLFEIEQKWVQNAKDYRLFDAFDGACFCLRDPRGFDVATNEMDSVISGFLECANDIPYLLEVLRLVLKTEHQAIDLIKSEAEAERMRLVGCGVAALANTPKTVKERIGRDHPYWSASYGDVCDAVDREMKYRTSLEDMTESRDSWKKMAQDLGISLAILQDAAEKIVSDNAPSDPEMLKESKRDWDVRVLKEALKQARDVHVGEELILSEEKVEPKPKPQNKTCSRCGGIGAHINYCQYLEVDLSPDTDAAGAKESHANKT